MNVYEIPFADFEKFCVRMLTDDPNCWQYVNFQWEDDRGNPFGFDDILNGDIHRAVLSIHNIRLLATTTPSLWQKVVLKKYGFDLNVSFKY